jgi:ComF family protein
VRPSAPSRLAQPLGALWELLFPTHCLGCGQRGAFACEACYASLPWLPPDVCPRCAQISRLGGLCSRCQRLGPSGLASVRAACDYGGLARTAIHQLKYRHGRVLAKLLARVLAESLARRPLDADIVVPVPLSQRRLRERGYNQSELIARELHAVSNLPPPSSQPLLRVRETRPQVGLSAAERRENVRGAFACPEPAALEGRRVLLLDDVMTTGATLRACADELSAAGATMVMALVVARDSPRPRAKSARS